MLSKMTFSLVFVLMSALVAGPALAQTINLSEDLNVSADDGTGEIAQKVFVVFEMTDATSALLVLEWVLGR